MIRRILLALGALLTVANVVLALALPAPVVPITTYSTNWAGYVASGAAGEFTGLTAEWRVPYVNCTATPFADSVQWIGLDGFKDKTVEQLGTAAECEYGFPVYGAWFEMYPADPVLANVTVKPGDLVRASLVEVSDHYSLVLTDLTTGKSASDSVYCGSSCERSSAEVISEAPSGGGGILPLADFGRVAFNDIQVYSNGAWQLYKVVQRQGKQTLQKPGAYSGNGFAVVWEGEGY